MQDVSPLPVESNPRSSQSRWKVPDDRDGFEIDFGGSDTGSFQKFVVKPEVLVRDGIWSTRRKVRTEIGDQKLGVVLASGWIE